VNVTAPPPVHANVNAPVNVHVNAHDSFPFPHSVPVRMLSPRSREKEQEEKMPDSALLAVDVQNDFCPGGALPVPAGDQVAETLTDYAERFHRRGLPVFASRDWHPPETKHFLAGGGPWPPHCVQGTPGAELHPLFRPPDDTIIVSKGMDPEEDAYSAFQALDPEGRVLERSLRDRGVRRIFIGGLATDYCVRASVMDARERGFEVVLLLDAIAGIDVKPGDVAGAIVEMVRAGADTATLASIDARLDEAAGEHDPAPPG